jgi:DNA polymerase (family 10)
MKHFEVARQFDLMADVLELKGENPFRIRAYRRAAQNLQSKAIGRRHERIVSKRNQRRTA